MSGNGAVSGGHRKRWSVSGARSGGLRSGNGAESGYSRNVLSVERLCLPLTLRSHALLVMMHDNKVNIHDRVTAISMFVVQLM